MYVYFNINTVITLYFIRNILFFVNDTKTNVVGICNWTEKYMSFDAYDKLLELMKLARITANTVFLFSATRFDPKLTQLSKENKSVVLVDMTEL